MGVMTQHLVAFHHPDDYDPAVATTRRCPHLSGPGEGRKAIAVPLNHTIMDVLPAQRGTHPTHPMQCLHLRSDI
jgi:hypothetical protein